LEPVELIKEAIKISLDGICLTEHDSIIPLWTLEKMKIPEGFFVFRGVEISTDQGHLLAYGLEDDFWSVWPGHNYLNAPQVIKHVHHLGGICVPAHPFRGWDSLGERVFRMDGFDAIETHNGRDLGDMNGKAIQAAAFRNLPSVGGGDCHKREQVGRAFTLFKNPVNTIDKMIEETKKGNCKGMIL
jgi:predicted metal-dependent phosphoesterase TrpH